MLVHEWLTNEAFVNRAGKTEDIKNQDFVL